VADHVRLLEIVRSFGSTPRIRHIGFSAFKLACPSLPTMMWSCTAMPSGRATSTIASVIWMSAREGVGSPEGCLCTSLRRVLPH
jgi:hypothetical protein